MIRVKDDVIDAMEADEIAELMREKIQSRGEYAADVVVIEGEAKETLRLYGAPHAVIARARGDVQRRHQLAADRTGLDAGRRAFGRGRSVRHRLFLFRGLRSRFCRVRLADIAPAYALRISMRRP